MDQKWFHKQIEEYARDTHELLTRRWKRRHALGVKEETEVGEQIDKTDEIKSAVQNPTFVRQDTLTHFQFRIRNLQNYSKEMFNVSVDPKTNEIVVRTSNKKYFKRFSIADLKRDGKSLDESQLAYEFRAGTLVVSYRKPRYILEKEAELRRELDKLNSKGCQEGDLECTLQ